jgi:hypothetical protein
MSFERILRKPLVLKGDANAGAPRQDRPPRPRRIYGERRPGRLARRLFSQPTATSVPPSDPEAEGAARVATRVRRGGRRLRL